MRKKLQYRGKVRLETIIFKIYTMKKFIIYLVMLAIIPLVNSCYDDGNLKDDINDLNSKYSSLENRIAALETQVKEINSEI